jgi:hypothetical protein
MVKQRPRVNIIVVAVARICGRVNPSEREEEDPVETRTSALIIIPRTIRPNKIPNTAIK